jgi:hypothetical protein
MGSGIAVLALGGGRLCGVRGRRIGHGHYGSYDASRYSGCSAGRERALRQGYVSVIHWCCRRWWRSKQRPGLGRVGGQASAFP